MEKSEKGSLPYENDLLANNVKPSSPIDGVTLWLPSQRARRKPLLGGRQARKVRIGRCPGHAGVQNSL